ncbi:ribonuclease H2, subunit B [Xylariaceae sp. FL0016]|nr:ribonuclease H2, subunit B [Xylariaceae sp. FL0016]
MPRTRSTNGTAAKADSKSLESTSASRFTLSQASENPPKIFILPRKAKKDARIVSLLNPRYNKPTRYLVCPETGFYEFTRVAAPTSTPRSWLIDFDRSSQNGEGEEGPGKRSAEDEEEFNTYITKSADLFIATPIDPLFLLLPVFTPTSSTAKSEKKMFVSLDDHLDTIQPSSPHLWEVMRWGEGSIRSLLESRMAAVCDTADAGETMFRFSEGKLLEEMLSKAKCMGEDGLPKSMEEKFVAKPLEAPVLGIKREASMTKAEANPTREESGASTPIPKSETGESQASVSSTDTRPSLISDVSSASAATVATSIGETEEAAAAITLAPSMTASDEVVRLQRMRVALNFLCSSYIPPNLGAVLKKNLSSPPPSVTPTIDFAPLDAYLKQLSQMRAEAMASRSADDYSRKRVLDDEEVAERAEKKRRKDEEEKKKKAGESRGVRDLKKVNTGGMRKMSDFFKKKT